MIGDSTVQHKAIAHPADRRLPEKARTKLVQAAKDVGIELKQTFTKEGKALGHKAGHHAHTRQFRRHQAIEPIIAHLKGERGDRLPAVQCAAGYNIR